MEAQAPAAAAAKPVGKIRNPWMVIILSIVTLGIYGIVYMYSTLEDLRNWRGTGWSGVLYLVFTFLFPFPLIALPWLLPSYVGNMYEADGQAKPITGMSGFWVLVPIIGGIIWILMVQGKMNDFWASKGAK